MGGKKVKWTNPDTGVMLETGIYMSKFSGFLMFIPFALIGMGEIMVNPVLYYFAYALTSTKTQCFIQAVNLLFQGSYPPAIASVLAVLLKNDQPDNLNRGHLEIFYYICLAVCILGMPIFAFVNWANGEMKDPNVATEDERNLGNSLTGFWPRIIRSPEIQEIEHHQTTGSGICMVRPWHQGTRISLHRNFLGLHIQGDDFLPHAT